MLKPKLAPLLTHRRFRWLRNTLLALGIAPLGMVFAPTAYALNAGSVSIQLVTDPLLVVDSNNCAGGAGPRASYVGFKITNTSGTTLNNIRVNLGGFNTAQGFNLSGGQAATQYSGTIAAGASDTVYWYMEHPCTQPLSNTLTVTVSDNNAGVVTGTGTVTTNSTISANAGGLVNSTVLGPGAVLGQIITYDVTYSFGNVQSGDRFNLQPAGNIGFNASCFQLVTSEITSSAVPGLTVGSKDQLFYLATSSKGGSGNLVSIRYYFLYQCAGVSTTARPYAAQTSGSTNVKYTGNYETQTLFSFPAATNAFTISKSASVSNLPAGGSVTYTVTITNTSPYNAQIEKIVDTLPAGVTFSGIAANSNVTAANSSSVPTVGSTGTLTWIGQPPNYYSVPANSSIKLIYTATILNVAGSYQNSVSASTGNTSTPTASTTVTVGTILTVSGRVWDDADNSANNTFTNINTGTETGTNAGGLYAILVSALGNVIGSTPVNADGTYSFSNILSSQGNVTIRLSTTPGTLGSAAPASSLPANWTNTSPLTQTSFNIGITNISGKDFGIEQLPNTNDVTAASQNNPGGTNTVQVSALSGTDPEDGSLGTGKSFKIVTLPTNGTLYYNGVAVTAGQVINNYDPTKLTLDPNDGALTASFTYAAIDAAGKEDPTPATVSMPFAASTADLSVTKTDGQTSTTAGSSITYTITVTNSGPSTVTSLTLTDPLPASIQSPSFTPSTGTYNSSTGAWTGLNLASGQSITLTINATVSSSAAVGALTNTATVAPPSGVIDSTSSNNTAIDTTYVYAIAPTAGRIVINEVLYAQTGSTLDGNDEFIELYNVSGTAVDLSNWRLADGNLIENSTDGVGSITGSSSNPAYVFPSGTILAPGQYAVIWIGNNTADHQATGAAFQTWLGQTSKLNNAGDDIWLYDAQTRIVDYVAYGSNNGINIPPPTSLNLWNSTYQSSLAGVSTGQSISLTPNGQDGNTSACWEPSTSGQASGRCTGYLATRDTDTVGSRITSVGVNNNVVVATPPNLLLVKRITAINGVNVTAIVDDPGSTNDNAANWPLPLNAANSISTYLRGAIDGGVVRPNDILEYTIYFLSNGGSPVTNVNLCDLVPANSTFIPASFSSSPESGISLSIGNTTTNLTNVPDTDGGEYFLPGAIPSVACSAANTNGAVMVRVVQSPANLPNATAPGTPNSYGFIRFRARVN